MAHTTLYKNESYLIITSIVSIGVLNGYEYFNLILAALIVAPVISAPVENFLNKRRLNSGDLGQCASCK